MPIFERKDARFASDGEECAADFYLPRHGDGPVPCIVMAHGFSGVRTDALPAYAERFAAAGFAVLLFDYRHFGDSGGEPRQLLSIAHQLADWRAAVAFARTLPRVDPDRIALWGTSFSGGHVVCIASEDPRIAAVVSQVPFADGLATAGAAPPKTALRLTLAGLRDATGALFGRPPHLIPAIGPEGSFAAMTAPGAEAGFQALLTEGSRWRNAFSARTMLRLIFYRPVRFAARLGMPLLVCVAERDATTPPGPSAQMARRAPRGELVTYPLDHFDIYVDGPFEQAIGDQLTFLRRVLGAGARPVAAAG